MQKRIVSAETIRGNTVIYVPSSYCCLVPHTSHILLSVAQHLTEYNQQILKLYCNIATLQMFAGIYGGFIGKSECGDFKFMGIACNPQSL